MGTASTTKVIKNVSGQLTELAALTTSAGAGDAQAIPALNASGILDLSITNGKNTSAGTADAGKLAALNAAGRLDDTILNASVTGAANAIAKYDASGRLDVTAMPVGIGADTGSIAASEALAAGDLVNIWSNAGTASVRKADGSTSGKEAHGFVLVAFAAAAIATVYFEGTNTAMTGLTPGVQFLSGTLAGKTVVTAPTGAGKVSQRVGFAISATSMNYDGDHAIVLAA